MSLIDATPAPDEVETEADRDEPPAKRSKQQHDSRSVSLRFLATASTSATPIHDFDHYLAASDAEDSNALQWWSQHANSYPLTAHVADSSGHVSAVRAAVFFCWSTNQ